MLVKQSSLSGPRWPPPLAPGDRVRLVAPAGPVAGERLAAGLAALRDRGYDVVVGAHVFAKEGFLAGRDELRLADLHEALADREARAVIAARGGYGTTRLLSRIDWRLLAEHPKILMGFSDVTALLAAAHAATRLVVFHGPMGQAGLTGDEGERFWRRERLLLGGPPSSTWDIGASAGRTEGLTLRPGVAEGRLVAGCLSLFAALCGTPFFPNLDGALLALEDLNEPAYRIDRMLQQLLSSGRCQRLAGLAVGDLVGCAPMRAVTDSFQRFADLLDIPAFTGLPFGHHHTATVVPWGVPARLDAASRRLDLLPSGRWRRPAPQVSY